MRLKIIKLIIGSIAECYLTNERSLLINNKFIDSLLKILYNSAREIHTIDKYFIKL